MVIFERTHKQFQQWRQANPTAYFANDGTSGWMLHRTTCPHFEDPTKPQTWSATTHEKVCGTREEVELEIGRRHQALAHCSHCMSAGKAGSA